MAVKKLKYFAGGQWLESKCEKYMDVYNPSTGEVQAQTPCCTKDLCRPRSRSPWRISGRMGEPVYTPFLPARRAASA
ncbi:MAG: hypothetical protein IK080_04825, partial [Clostridia bacterium]|nr:hypothetical protein [Clostridia bacterium]